MTLQELTEKAIALPKSERLALIQSVKQSLEETPSQESWKFLWSYPHTWRQQLYMKGRKLPASIVWSDMLTNKMTMEETADNWDLTLAEVKEAVCYCESHRELIAQEAKIDREALTTETIAS
ncbi:MAG: hypothetical protein AAFS04_04425 [Cyanobacteria bacterium J06631_9]